MTLRQSSLLYVADTSPAGSSKETLQMEIVYSTGGRSALTHKQAASLCQENNASLVTAETEEKRKALKNFLLSNDQLLNVSNMWIAKTLTSVVQPRDMNSTTNVTAQKDCLYISRSDNFTKLREFDCNQRLSRHSATVCERETKPNQGQYVQRLHSVVS